MNFARYTAVALAAVSISFASCKKDDEKATPSAGSMTYGGKAVNFTTSTAVTNMGIYALVAQGEADNKTYQLSLSSASGAPTAGEVDASAAVMTLAIVAKDGSSVETHTYAKSGEKITVSGAEGSRKFVFTNLTEITTSGTGTSISGSMQEME